MGVSFGLCIATATPSVDDRTQGTIHQTAPGSWGNRSTHLTFERFLLVEDTLTDCAKTQCELRVRVLTPATGVAQMLREPLVFADSPTRAIDLGISDTLEHRVPREVRITGLDDAVGDRMPTVEQCVRTTDDFVRYPTRGLRERGNSGRATRPRPTSANDHGESVGL